MPNCGAEANVTVLLEVLREATSRWKSAHVVFQRPCIQISWAWVHLDGRLPEYTISEVDGAEASRASGCPAFGQRPNVMGWSLQKSSRAETTDNPKPPVLIVP